MNRITFLVDGFNLYHSLLEADYYLSSSPTKWLNIKALCESYLYLISPDATLEKVYYFSALAYHKGRNAVRRHRKFIKCLEETGIEKELGGFKRKEIKCDNCEFLNVRREEKETDVAIGSKLIEIYLKNECDSAVILSGDTDLRPAVKLAQSIYPSKLIYFIFPYRRKNKELKTLVDGRTFKIKPQKYSQFQFPNPFILSNGERLHKPSSW